MKWGSGVGTGFKWGRGAEVYMQVISDGIWNLEHQKHNLSNACPDFLRGGLISNLGGEGSSPRGTHGSQSEAELYEIYVIITNCTLPN